MYLARKLLLTVSASLICSLATANYTPLVDATVRAMTVDQVDKYIGMIERADVVIHVHANRALEALGILRILVEAKSDNNAKRGLGAQPTQEQCRAIIDSLALRLKERVFMVLLDDFINPINEQSLRYYVEQFVLFMQRPDGSYEPGYEGLVDTLRSIQDVCKLAEGPEVAKKVAAAMKSLPAHIQKLVDSVFEKRSDKERLTALNKRIKNNRR